MIRRHNFQSKQNGIVLLSCLIFLLMLLTLMRFTIGSAKLSEMKVGADFDQMNAEQAAHSVMYDAEQFILRKRSNGKAMDKPAVPADVNNITEEEKNEMMSLAIDFWKKNNVTNEQGIYNGISDPCTDSKCTNHVDWQTGTGAIATNDGYYIIERFLADDLRLGPGNSDTIVLRVTGVGSVNKAIVGDDVSKVLLQNTYILSKE